MSTLTEWLQNNTAFADANTGVDLILCRVVVADDADSVILQECIKDHTGIHNTVDIFDGTEHGYIELGGWLGDQGLALRLIAAGFQLKLWNLLTPKTMLGDGLPEIVYRDMAGRGLITVAYPYVEKDSVVVIKNEQGSIG